MKYSTKKFCKQGTVIGVTQPPPKEGAWNLLLYSQTNSLQIYSVSLSECLYIRLLNKQDKALQAPLLLILGGGCVILITVPYCFVSGLIYFFRFVRMDGYGYIYIVGQTAAVYRESTKILYILYPAQDFCTERYGKLSNQQLFLSVNGPFVPSCLDLITNYYL